MNKTEFNKLSEDEKLAKLNEAAAEYKTSIEGANASMELIQEKLGVPGADSFQQVVDALDLLIEKAEAPEGSETQNLEDQIIVLSEKLAALEKSSSDEEPTVTVDEVEYRIIGKLEVVADKSKNGTDWPTVIEKKVISARELAKFPKYAAYLLSINSGQLIEVQPLEKEK